jgi:hypothetical protein
LRVPRRETCTISLMAASMGGEPARTNRHGSRRGFVLSDPGSRRPPCERLRETGYEQPPGNPEGHRRIAE